MKSFANQSAKTSHHSAPHKSSSTSFHPTNYIQRDAIGAILNPKKLQKQSEEEEALQAKDMQKTNDSEEELQTKPSKVSDLQRQTSSEEEELQSKPLQKAAKPEEEPLQTQRVQRKKGDELQPKCLQRNEEEEPLQTKKLQKQEVEEEALQTQSIQRKLNVGQPDDKYEQEADSVADQVMRMPSNQIQKQSMGEQEEETVQTKSLANQISPLVQRQSSDPIEEELQTKSTVGDSSTVSQETESKINQMRGRGNSLSPNVEQEMGQKIGADFSGVNVHTGSDAADLNRQVNARAFTVGNDVFFNNGEYAPESDSGKRLLAHELTHVVQQRGAGNSVQRDDTLTNEFSDSTGSIDTTNKTLRIKNLKVPTFKNRFYQSPSGKLGAGAHEGKPTWRRNASTGGEERDTNQISVWETGVRDEADDKVDSKLRRAHSTTEGSSPVYYFSYNSGNSFLIGTESVIKQRCRRPLWTQSGVPTAMQVDHQLEYQTYGADSLANMWLLNGSVNGQSGREIRAEIRSKVSAFVTKVQDKVLNPPSDTDDARTHYKIYFDPIRSGLGSYDAIRAKNAYYTQSHIKDGDHLRGLNPMSQTEINNSGLLEGNAENIQIFPSSTGGYRYNLTKDASGNTYQLSTQSVRGVSAQNFTISSVTFDTATKEGSINITVPSESLAARLSIPFQPKPIDPISIAPMDGIEWGGRFDAASLKSQVTAALDDFPGMSPLHLDDVVMNAGGIGLTGTITPTIPIIENSSVNFALDGENLSVWKTFTGGDFNVPSPFSINNTSLSLGVSTQGLFVRGDVGFGINNVGEGSIGAAAEASFDGETGISLNGEFKFDERIFGEGTTATVRVGYEDDLWSMGGTLTIPEGKVAGVKSATIEVNYSESDGFSASGDAELDIPGVEAGRLEVSQSEEEGFSIGGEFTLSSETPGIRGGRIGATITEREDGSGYAVSATGEAQPDIPGINSNLSVTYNDGAFTAEVEADYARGMLSGRLNAGVTNRTVNEEGELSETAEPDNPLIVYGGGSLTIQIAPWLQGTAGVQFAPNGEITVTGEIGLPDELEIFARREINRSIFNIAVQAPIFPGIVAEIGGGLGATAGIGPGVIDELRLGITYNPEREEDTTITGDAHLNIPADAGLRLSVRAGIGLGITGASATGGLEIGGTLGIEGAAEAGVHVEWSPSSGLDLRANLGIHAQPAFTFDISGYVSVRALGLSVYDQTWELASFRFGSDYRFGISMPIHYQEGQPFEISTDDIEFEVPDIDTNQLLRGLVSRIA